MGRRGHSRGSGGDRQKLDAAVRVAQSVGGPRQLGILVVEDDPDLQWNLARMLTVHGNRVVGTSSGDGALALIREWPVDLVLVDEDLPRMTGIEVARYIRADFPHIPVVLMTGSPPEPEEGALPGVVACLVKPFRVEALTELLESVVAPALVEPAE